MKIVYRKLVRDNIPDICIANNQKPKYRVLEADEYKKAFNGKLKEETNEYLRDNDIEELADILEVVEALAVNQGSSLDEVIMIKKAKADKYGSFKKRYFLESVVK